MTFEATSGDGQRIDLPPGVTTSHFLLKHHDVVFDGNQRATLAADGSFGTLFQAAFPPQTPDGKPVRSLTIRNCTLDGRDMGSMVSLVGGTKAAGPLAITLSNVGIVGVHRDTIAVLSAGALETNLLRIVGDGGGILGAAGSLTAKIRATSTVGGRYGFVIAADVPGSVPGPDVDGFDVDIGLTQSPRYEAVTATAIGDLYVDVESHVVAHRSMYDTIRVLTPVCWFDSERDPPARLVQPGDRVETDEAWCRVLAQRGAVAVLDDWRATGSWRAVPRPSARAIAYRPTFGRVWHWSKAGEPGRLWLQRPMDGLPAAAAWRTAIGARVATPVLVPGTRVDVLRHGLGSGPRDYDVGAVHITATARGGILRNVTTHDTGADSVTSRALGGARLVNCRARVSRDMCFTGDGTHGEQVFEWCEAFGAGVAGFWLGLGPSRLEACVANGNGGYGDNYGVFVDDKPAFASYIQVTGDGGALGLCNRPDLLVADSVRRDNRATKSSRSRGGGSGRASLRRR